MSNGPVCIAHTGPVSLCERALLELDEQHPLLDPVPGVTFTDLTVASAAARSSFSIFIASITSTPWPAMTVSPGATATRTTSPGIGATTGAGPAGGALRAVISRIVRARSSSASTS